MLTYRSRFTFFGEFLSVITLRIDFVMYSPINSNVQSNKFKLVHKRGLHNLKKWKSHKYVNFPKSNRSIAENYKSISNKS